ncbi:MAG TPA: PEGA domain-containing protein [Vicinamibacterales bacterium]|nr:PEGA domain-containing protein [Vicinamibacterales bacterium]
MWYDRCSSADVRYKNILILGCAGVLLALISVSSDARPVLTQWHPYPGIGFPPMPGFYPGDHYSSLRIQVSPRQALVYVDGYAAGIVDDYDGVFQRLQLVPGHHEIVVYLQGYRVLRQNLYLNPRSSHTIKHTLEPLGAGEVGEPQPSPRALPLPPGAPMTGIPIPGMQSARVGTLALRVQPADASVYIDGELWRGPQGQDRLVIQLGEGAHRVRVEKPGFQSFDVNIDVRSGETTSFNVSLVQ